MLRKQIKRAHELQDFGTVEVLEEVLLDREDLGYHLYSVLEDDTLTRGMQHLLHEKGNISGDQQFPSCFQTTIGKKEVKKRGSRASLLFFSQAGLGGSRSPPAYR